MQETRQTGYIFLLRMNFLKNQEKGGASITVIYTGFPNNAVAAVEYAVSILETILPADAQYYNLGQLGEDHFMPVFLPIQGVPVIAGGWTIDARNPLAIYPVALAEKIAGKSLNDSLDG